MAEQTELDKLNQLIAEKTAIMNDPKTTSQARRQTIELLVTLKNRKWEAQQSILKQQQAKVK